MTFIEVYPEQQFLSLGQNGTVDDGHLQKVAIEVIFRHSIDFPTSPCYNNAITLQVGGIT